MTYKPYQKRDAIKNYFPLPNEVFMLGLNAGEISVYSYLLYLEDRQTRQCWPSYKTIGKAMRMSQNTVRKHVQGLEAKRLIRTEPTTICDKHGRKRNGNLLYTIRPVQEAIDFFHERQLLRVQQVAERQRVAAQLAKDKRVASCEPPCGDTEGTVASQYPDSA